MTPGDHGAIKLLLDAKLPAAVNGMLATAKSQGSWNQGGGRSILLPTFFVSRVESNLCPTNQIHICRVPRDTNETRGH